MKIKIQKDEITDQIQKNFTIEGDEISFEPHQLDKSKLPKDFAIGVIIGKSGSGKSILLKEFGNEVHLKWDNNKSIASHFKDYDEAEERLLASGLGSVPSWLKPYNVLSNGEKHRADLARIIDNDIVIDEFVSYVDNNASLGLCNSMQKYIRNKNLKNIVLATLNHEILDYLKPDWVYDCDNRTLSINSDIWDIEIDEEISYKKIYPFMEIN